MRKSFALVTGVMAALAMAGPAQAAKTYDDPWVEGDLQQLRVPAALDILARTPSHVIVGVVDSGARLTDPDLAPHLLTMSKPYTCTSFYGSAPDYAADPANGDTGCDFIGSGTEGGPTTVPDGDPADPFGHGTGSAEVIAGVANNGKEGAGVAPNARVLPIRACWGSNPDCDDAVALAGFKYAVAMGATIINASWPPATTNSALLQYVQGEPNVLFVFAIGGSDQNDDPYAVCQNRTTYPNVICVGLANANDTPGTTNGDQTTDVSAPGNAGVPTASGAHGEYANTSGAAAHVTGAAAVLRGLAPDLTPSAIRQVLVSTSRQVSGYTHANRAHGIVDLEAAVRSVQQTEGLVTPAAGHGAAADSPDPFPGQSVGDPGAGGGTGGGTGGTNPGGTTTTPGTTAPPAPTPAPAPGPTPTPVLTPSVALTVTKPPSSVRAGATLTLHLHLTGATGSITVTLSHGKKTLVKTTKHHATGAVTLKLRLPKAAKTGKATLTIKSGTAKPLVRTITVGRHT